MFKFKKLTALALASIITAGALVGCTNNKREQADDTSNKKSSEITFMVPDWGAPTKEMLDDFKSETGVEVKVLPASWEDIKKKVSIASSGSKAPADVFEVDWSWVGEFQSTGWLEKMDVTKETVDDMPSISSFKIGDSYYAIPYVNDVRMAYINKDMLDKAGVVEGSEVKVPSNWNEMTAAFDKMMEKGVVKHPFLFPLSAEEKTTTSFITLAYTRNGVLFNKDNTLNKDAVYDTFRFLEDALNRGYINPASVSTPGMDTFRDINNGNGAFIIGPTFILSSSQDPKESKVVGQVSPMEIPGKTEPSKVDVSFTEAVGISKYSENKDAARKFVKWYTSPKIQMQLNKNLNTMPTRTSVLEEMAKNDSVKGLDVLINESKKISNPFPNGVPKYYAQMSSEIYNTVNRLGKKEINAQQATDRLVEAVYKLKTNEENQ